LADPGRVFDTASAFLHARGRLAEHLAEDVHQATAALLTGLAALRTAELAKDVGEAAAALTRLTRRLLPGLRHHLAQHVFETTDATRHAAALRRLAGLRLGRGPLALHHLAEQIAEAPEATALGLLLGRSTAHDGFEK
jgi:hypothetical protein